ncbi:MAG: hypothetical protein HY544_01595 [Candidatus Diapherotrites archaeon]|uniref:Uncharacterized protein n=1 Tax=Candidatus Iainarchaeum sp. TaxID=3101447 RepID=A0A8T3YIU6_9ARCH|nr:hypothetical protein [Candidatus Diapherotrites archaeon]
MTTKNAILLIAKQNPGIDYNSLLTKFSHSYSNPNSARAALSRSLKDLTTLGYLVRKENRYSLLEKGEAEIYSEIKNKLVLGLNMEVGQKRAVDAIDSIVAKLQVLIERGRQDRDLLKTSKGSLDFPVSELDAISESLDKKVRHLEYISRVFSEQVRAMKELGFNDSFARAFDEHSVSSLLLVFSGQPDQEFIIEAEPQAVLGAICEKASAKARPGSVAVAKDSLRAALAVLSENKGLFNAGPARLFSSSLRAEFFPDRVVVSGPFNEVSKWKQ